MPSGGRTQPIQNRKEFNNTLTDKGNGRRSSATTVSQRPPIPSINRNRSQSLDALLDENETAENQDTTANASEDASEQTGKGNKQTNNEQNDETEQKATPRENSPQKSILSSLNPRLNQSETNSIGSSTSLVNREQNSNESSLNPDDTKSSCSTPSAQYSVGSESSDPKRNLLNKYVKKVKNLIKK